MARHPAVRWILWEQTPQGFLARCEVCGAVVHGLEPDGVDAFASAHSAHQSASPRHFGLGDVVAAGTKALGIQPCAPCEARRRVLNQAFPKIWRR